jgi:hypothetical protein
MTPKLVETLLNIASESNRWPRLKHLRDEALQELESAHLNCVEQVIPIMIVDRYTDGKAEAEPAPRAASAIPRGMT